MTNSSSLPTIECLEKNLIERSQWQLQVLSEDLFCIRRYSIDINGDTSIDDIYNIAVIPDLVILYGPAGVQNFYTDESFDVIKFGNYFPDESAILKRSIFYTEGETSHGSFLKQVFFLYENSRITIYEKEELEKFIASCDCPPAVVKQKLFKMGYENLFPDSSYTLPRKELLSFSEKLKIFISLLSQHYSEVQR